MTFAKHLDSLEKGVCDDTANLATLLRTVMLIGAHASSDELRHWALKELDGYCPGAGDLPDYRRISAPLQMNIRIGPENHTGRNISLGMLPEDMRDLLAAEVPMTWGVAEIEATVHRQASSGTVQLTSAQGPEIAARLSVHLRQQADSPFLEVYSVYWAVSPAVLHGILDRIRTRLTLFVAELRATMPPGDSTPSNAAVAQAAQVMEIRVTTGDNSSITIQSPQAQASSGGTAEAVSQSPRESPAEDTPKPRRLGLRRSE